MMDRKAVLHIPKSNYAFPVTPKDFKIRLRVGKGDLDQVWLVIGNQYRWTTREKFPMEKWSSDALYDYYQYTYHCTDTRLGYYFLLNKGEEELIYAENGFLQPGSVDVDHDRIGFVHFQFPYINPTDVHKKPSWVNGAVFYQIFPERFCNGDPSLSPEDTAAWGEKPTRRNFFGGDLKGIAQKLDYLQELGVNALYLCPIFEAYSNHKYDTIDYTRIDPHFGDESDLVELVQKAHEHGIRIMLDGVFNHCGGGFRQWEDVVKHGEQSPFKEWFHVHEFPVSFDPINFEGFGTTAFVPRGDAFKEYSPELLRKACMPKLNTENPEVREYLLGAVAKWTRIGIDGWRLDVADEVDARFWREFRKTVHSINPDAVIIGEVWWNAEPWLRGDQFDGVMNYGAQRAAVRYFARDTLTPEEFAEALTENLIRYTDMANDSMLNLLDSHDTPRFVTTCGGNRGRLKNAAAFQYSFVGMPCTYYGTEIGMEGEDDPDCRRTFDWDESRWDKGLWAYYHRLMELRKSKKALQYGTVRFLPQGEVFAMERALEGERLLTVINNTEAPQPYELQSGGEDLLNGGTYNAGALTVPPQCAMILELKQGQDG